MLPSQVDTAASQTAEVVAADRPVTAPILRAVVREVTSRTLVDLERQVQSLMAQVANLSGHQGVPFHNQAPTQAQGQGRGRGGRGGTGGQGRGGQGQGRSDPPLQERNANSNQNPRNDQGFWPRSGRAAAPSSLNNQNQGRVHGRGSG